MFLYPFIFIPGSPISFNISSHSTVLSTLDTILWGGGGSFIAWDDKFILSISNTMSRLECGFMFKLPLGGRFEYLFAV